MRGGREKEWRRTGKREESGGVGGGGRAPGGTRIP